MRRTKSPAASAWHEVVATLPCVLCHRLGEKQRSRTSVHHDTVSAGMAQRAGDMLVAALCQHECHQGPHGVHGDKSRLYRAKVSEADLVNDTIGLGIAALREVLGHNVGRGGV